MASEDYDETLAIVPVFTFRGSDPAKLAVDSLCLLLLIV
jgi:hypothetical protein